MVGFIFDAQRGETPTSLARRRKLAEAMLAQSLSRAPKDMGEGLTAIGQAIAARVLASRADKAEKAGLEGFSGKWGDAFDGPGEFPAAPSTTRDTSYSPPSRPDQDASLGSSVDFARTKPNDLAAGIRETAKALGIDPIDLGTAISYETAGSFDPTKKGPTTQWGQHRGLIQFGEPQAAKYGVNWDDPVGSQLGADGAVAKYLRDTGVKPGMGMLDIYSAINAGGVGRYGASDANNGGAPGTVADKVNNQMAGHRRKALALLGGGDEPVQVASLDQSIGLASPDVSGPVEKRRRVVEALAGVNADRQPDPIRARVADALIGQRGGGINVASMREQQLSRLLSPDVMGDGAGFVQTSRDAPIQMAQARNGQMSDADALAGFGARPYQQGQGGPSLEQLYQLAADPWASDEQRAILGNMIKQKQEESDPLRQLQLQKAQLELGALQNPDDWAKLDDGRLFHKRTGEIKDVPGAPGQSEMFGGKSVDAQALNWLVANNRLTPEQAAQMAAGKTVSGPNGELLFLKPEDVFRQASETPAGDAQPGMIQLTPPKVTLDEKKAMTFADRMTTSGGIIDQFGDAGLGFKDRVLSNVPIIGNSLVSDEYQQLDQARRDFINAQLRRESGAVISPEEFDNANKQYFPQPGDTKETLEQKRKNRETVVLGMQRDGGPTYQPPGGALPDGITEDDIDFTMKKHGLTREQVLERLRNAP